ncbi:acetate uptake transporter [Methanohalophilus sp.]|uniref:acetate uptake transporter n=1 Tax=Methanohalophilus sp. TaxID=1966352 RepID=UPI00262F7923|nr:acetate uptake transporter [Methanohalophilus sp.]MDK2891814.1 uncharacterized protein [Methanohalophilus sp.]
MDIEENEAKLNIVDNTANPAALGFTGLGLSAFLLSLTYVGLFPLDTMIVSMAIFLGGFAQVFAGIMAWKKGDVFAGTAFGAFGLFWFSLAGLIIIDSLGWAASPTPIAMAAYLAMWGVYTLGMLIATLKLGSRAIQFVFVTLFVLFILLAMVNAGSGGLLFIAGIDGLLLGLASLYTALAIVLNEVYGKTILPI